MDDLVTVEDISARLPVPWVNTMQPYVEQLIADAATEIDIAFQRRGRDWEREVSLTPWLRKVSAKCIREMVAAAVVIGPSVGIQSGTSTSGPITDSVSYGKNTAEYVSFSGVRLTDDMLEELGLLRRTGARGTFPRPLRWPEVSDYVR